MRRFRDWVETAPDWQWNLFTLCACAIELAILTTLARLGVI